MPPPSSTAYASSPAPVAPVLVTGLTGYIGSRLALQLLQRGYAVRGTVRDTAKAARVCEALGRHVSTTCLEVVEAELLDAASWTRAAAGVEAVMHVASPIAAVLPDDPEAMVTMAREGTLNVLRAATAASARRVVMTSSLVTVAYGLTEPVAEPITEARWTDPEGNDDHTPYVLSKLAAERAAWAYVRDTDGAPDLVTIHPGAVLGPLLTDTPSVSLIMVSKLLRGELPGAPKIGFEVVDVRDVADLHIRALETPVAAGERYLAVSGYRTLMDVADQLRTETPAYATRLPRIELLDWLVRVFARVDADTRGVLNELGRRRISSSAKARAHLGWDPRPADEAIAAAAHGLIEHGLV